MKIKAFLLILTLTSTFVDTCLCCNDDSTFINLEKCIVSADQSEAHSCCNKDKKDQSKDKDHEEGQHQNCQCAHAIILYVEKAVNQPQQFITQIENSEKNFYNPSYFHLYSERLLRPPQIFI